MRREIERCLIEELNKILYYKFEFADGSVFPHPLSNPITLLRR